MPGYKPFGELATDFPNQKNRKINSNLFRKVLPKQVSREQAIVEAGILFLLARCMTALLILNGWNWLPGMFCHFGVCLFAAWRPKFSEKHLDGLFTYEAALLFLLLVMSGISDLLAFRLEAWLAGIYGWDHLELPFALIVFGRPLTLWGFLLLLRFLFMSHYLGRQYLRWRLTAILFAVAGLSHLVMPLILGNYLGRHSLTSAPTVMDPLEWSQIIARHIKPYLAEMPENEVLNRNLSQMYLGKLKVPVAEDNGDDIDLLPAASSLAFIALCTPGGEMEYLATSHEKALSQEAVINMEALVKNAAREGKSVVERTIHKPFADLAATPIYSESGVLQAVVVVKRLERGGFTEMWAKYERMMNITITTLGFKAMSFFIYLPVFMLLTAFAGYLVSSRLTKRLEVLTVATREFAEGRLFRQVKIQTEDELGLLAGHFNQMAAQLREREVSLRQEKHKAEKLLQENRRLVADISHELRSPIALLKSYVEVLGKNQDLTSSKRDLKVLHKQADRLGTLVAELFTLTQLENRQISLKKDAVNGRELLLKIKEALAMPARKERHLELIDDLPIGLPLIECDGKRLEQALFNVVQNALNHTPAGGLILLGATWDEQWVSILVEDTGVGIGEKELPRIFDRFYRADDSRSRETGGAGLGLALVKEWITAMGGSVHVASMPGEGSRFELKLRRFNPEINRNGSERSGEAGA